MLGCRRSRQNTIQLLAWAPRSCAFANTGFNNRVNVTSCEGTNWYFNEHNTWGFAKEGDVVDKDDTCDHLDSGSNNLRLCWWTEGTGFRCGSYKYDYRSESDYERVIFQTGKK